MDAGRAISFNVRRAVDAESALAAEEEQEVAVFMGVAVNGFELFSSLRITATDGEGARNVSVVGSFGSLDALLPITCSAGGGLS
jgi:hypothetical protein